MSDPNGWELIETAPKGVKFLGYRAIDDEWGICVHHPEWGAVSYDYDDPTYGYTHWKPLDKPDPGYWERRQALKERREDIE